MNNTKRWFCTLFDQNYLIKGLVMYHSLIQHNNNICLFVLCMDDVTYRILEKLKLPRLVLIRLKEFETKELLSIKAERSVAEYCWTCTPSILSYIIHKFPEINYLTYLDADLMFFSDTKPIFDEIENSSVAIIEHRFSKGFEDSIVNGKYNVQWVGFRRDDDGLEVLNWWREKCLEWCYNRSDDGRFGDQKYLDNWTSDFNGVQVIQHLGAGVGPWNFASYKIAENYDGVTINEQPLIFYHFHGYKMIEDGGFTAMPRVYMDNKVIPYSIYEPYRHALWKAAHVVQSIVPNFVEGILESPRKQIPAMNKYLTQNEEKKSLAMRIMNKLNRMISA